MLFNWFCSLGLCNFLFNKLINGRFSLFVLEKQIFYFLYRQGVALQCLGRHGEALAAFSQGLVQDPNSQQLLSGLVEASIKSPLRHNLEPTFQQLEAMKLDQSPFVLVSVVGQVRIKILMLFGV